MLYLWLKAVHIIAVICWYAGLFYLPRLFVYHADSQDEISLKRFEIMEWRLWAYIMTPSAIVTVLTGGLIIHLTHIVVFPIWLQIKLGLVLTLIAYHVLCWVYLQDFARRQNTKTSRYFRFFNEYPSLVLIAVVFLVVFRSPA